MMKKNHRNLIALLEAARPANGKFPVTEAEWAKLQTAHEELAYEMYLAQGMNEHEAWHTAKLIHDGPLGRLLLESCFPRRSR